MKCTQVTVKLSEGLPGYNNMRSAEIVVTAEPDEDLDVISTITSKIQQIRLAWTVAFKQATSTVTADDEIKIVPLAEKPTSQTELDDLLNL